MNTLATIFGFILVSIPLVSLFVVYAVITLASDKEYEKLTQRVKKRKNQKDKESK